MSGYLHPDIEKAYAVLETGTPVSFDLAAALGRLPGEATLDLISLAHKVKNRYGRIHGNVHACSIMNAKSGVCGENCRFCAQSKHNNADIEVYDLVDAETVLEQARKIREQGIMHFGIVTSGYGYCKITPEFERLLAIIDLLHRELSDLRVCASFGILGEEPARVLAAHDIAHYNINLQVAPARYGELIADTHPIEDRINTIKLLRGFGVSVCCGGIIGTGETMQDRIVMMSALKGLDVSVIPLNVLVPIDGTPLEGMGSVPVDEIARTFAICRLLHPDRIIKFAAGRETVMKDFQGLLMLSGADGMLTGGYLTTRGRDIADDQRFLHLLQGFT
jgi:biotin synthase